MGTVLLPSNDIFPSNHKLQYELIHMKMYKSRFKTYLNVTEIVELEMTEITCTM